MQRVTVPKVRIMVPKSVCKIAAICLVASCGATFSQLHIHHTTQLNDCMRANSHGAHTHGMQDIPAVHAMPVVHAMPHLRCTLQTQYENIPVHGILHLLEAMCTYMDVFTRVPT